MNFVFRVDSSINIGSGHLMRCLTLADRLSGVGGNVSFISRKHLGNLNAFIAEKGYKVFELPLKDSGSEAGFYSKWLGATWVEDAQQVKIILAKIKPDILFVDHYALDYEWEHELKSQCSKLVVIDDLASRKHDCDVLIDQTFGRVLADYKYLVPEGCLLCLGSHYAMLRNEFSDWREFSLRRRKPFTFKKLLISLGGVDKDNVTTRILKSLEACQLPDTLQVTVVLGANAPHIDSVKELAKQLTYKTTILTNIVNMAEYMARNDLAIGAAGSTSWERCCLGLPSLMIVIADNQENIARNLQEENAAIIIEQPLEQNLLDTIEKLDASSMECLSINSSRLVDGQGVKRVVESITAS